MIYTTKANGEYVWKAGRIFEVKVPFRVHFIEGHGSIQLRKGDMLKYVGCQNLRPNTFRAMTRIFEFNGDQYFTNDWIEAYIDPCEFY